MAINVLKEDYKSVDGLKATSVEFANGDLEALKTIQRAYGFASMDDALAFAIGFLMEANGRPVAVVKEDGRIAKFIPAKATKEDGHNS